MVELLAPAGNLPMVEGAVANGANAIYVGPRGWSRRRDQYEMSDEDVRAAIGIAHAGGAKLRVAFNTNMQSHEIAPMLEKMERFVSWGVDGAIMTDIGAIAEVHRRFPHLTIHASIGANILNNEDVRFYRSIGVSQVVADTKLTLRELASRKEQIDVGIEILIHANKCYTYLGKCWMSPYHRLERTTDSFGKDLFKGSPNRGGLDYRVCLESWELYSGEEKWENSVALKNDAFFLLEDIPHLIDLEGRVPESAGARIPRAARRAHGPLLPGSDRRLPRFPERRNLRPRAVAVPPRLHPDGAGHGPVRRDPAAADGSAAASARDLSLGTEPVAD